MTDASPLFSSDIESEYYPSSDKHDESASEIIINEDEEREIIDFDVDLNPD